MTCCLLAIVPYRYPGSYEGFRLQAIMKQQWNTISNPSNALWRWTRLRINFRIPIMYLGKLDLEVSLVKSQWYVVKFLWKFCYLLVQVQIGLKIIIIISSSLDNKKSNHGNYVNTKSSRDDTLRIPIWISTIRMNIQDVWGALRQQHLGIYSSL